MSKRNKRDYERVTHHFLLLDSPSRLKSINTNARLLTCHKLTALTVFIFLIYQGISDENLVEDYRAKGVFYYMLFSYVAFFGAHMLAAAIMYIPAFMFAKNIGPEIILFDDYMVYLGGSMALNYSRYTISLFPPFKYLLGVDKAQVLLGSEVHSAIIERAKFLKPAYGFGSWISITHDKGKLVTGIWLTDDQKEKIIESITSWMENSRSETL